MNKKIRKLPFILAPMLFITAWGFFFFKNDFKNFFQIILWVTIIFLQSFFIIRKYPVVSVNSYTAFFVLFSTLLPVVRDFSGVNLFFSTLLIPIVFLLSTNHNSFKLISYLGTLIGIILLFSIQIGILYGIIPIIFILVFSRQDLKFRLIIIFIFSVIQILFIFYLLKQIVQFDMPTINLNLVKDDKINKIKYLVSAMSILLILLSIGDYFRLKINRRKHILSIVFLIFSYVLFSIFYESSLIYFLFPLLWFILTLMLKNSKHSFLTTLLSVLYAILFFFINLK